MLNLKNPNLPGPPSEQFDIIDIRKKRDEYTVEIRKQKRDQLLNKKRNVNQDPDQMVGNEGMTDLDSGADASDEFRNFVEDCRCQSYTVDDLPELLIDINSNDRLQLHRGVIGIRKMLSVENNPPIQEVIDANLVPRLIHLMTRSDEHYIQPEATWALTNIASGDTHQTQSIIDKGGIPCFIELMRSKRPEVAEQAIWAIGNISGDSARHRDKILDQGGLDPLIAIIVRGETPASLKQGTWALSNLCRGRPLPEYEKVKRATPILSKVIQETQDYEVLIDAIWAMSYLSDGPERVEFLLSSGIMPSLVRHLNIDYLSILIPVLRTVGNILSGNHEHVGLALQVPGLIEKLFALLDYNHKAVRREACWALSNVAAGNADQIELVVGDTFKIQKFIQLIDENIPELTREAVWVLSNATVNAIPSQIIKLCSSGVPLCFNELLDTEDYRLLEIVLDGIDNILRCDKMLTQQNGYNNLILTEFEQIGIIGKIDKLQLCENSEIYKKALNILESYCELEKVTNI